MNAGLSRWTMAYFAAALVAFLAAQLLMAAGLTFPGEPLASGFGFVGLHLITIGWLTLLMIGALLQFVPVITGKAAIGERAGLVSLVAILAGLAGMIAGFLALAGVLPAECLAALPVGGSLVVLGVGVAGFTIGRVLVASRPLLLPARFVAAGLVFLGATVILGLCFGLTFAWPGLLPADWLLDRGFEVHIASGLVGWLALTAIGVSYRLLSMFMLSPEDEGWVGRSVLWLAVAGLVLLWLAAFLEEPAAGRLQGVAVLALFAAVVLYLFDMARTFLRRKRPILELNSIAGAAALTLLAIAAASAAALAAMGRLADFAGPLGYLFLFGWLSGLALGQLYKIVPFLTWLERYGPLLGKEPVPRVQDLVDQHRAMPWFLAYFAGVILGAVAGALGFPLLWRGAAAIHLLATCGIARELWRARYVRPTPGAARPKGAAPFPSSRAGVAS